MKVTIEIKGETRQDITDALEEIIIDINNGYTSGFDSSDTGEFVWNSEEMEPE